MNKEKYEMGIDLAIKPKWWQIILSWVGIKKYRADYSCMVIGKRDKDGVLHIIDTYKSN